MLDYIQKLFPNFKISHNNKGVLLENEIFYNESVNISTNKLTDLSKVKNVIIKIENEGGIHSEFGCSEGYSKIQIQIELKTFVDSFFDDELTGDLNDLVDDAIEDWHKSTFDFRKLHESLGMTWEEYGEFLKDSKIIYEIIERYSIHIPNLELLEVETNINQGKSESK